MLSMDALTGSPVLISVIPLLRRSILINKTFAMSDLLCQKLCLFCSYVRSCSSTFALNFILGHHNLYFYLYYKFNELCVEGEQL